MAVFERSGSGFSLRGYLYEGRTCDYRNRKQCDDHLYGNGFWRGRNRRSPDLWTGSKKQQQSSYPVLTGRGRNQAACGIPDVWGVYGERVLLNTRKGKMGRQLRFPSGKLLRSSKCSIPAGRYGSTLLIGTV